VPVYYDGEIIGAYKADLVVDGKLLVEVKAEPSITGVHERQLRNYLAATSYEVGIILSYGLEPKHKRMNHTRNLKKSSRIRGRFCRIRQIRANSLERTSARRAEDLDPVRLALRAPCHRGTDLGETAIEDVRAMAW